MLDRRAEGLLLAQQGRVARQLGAMATAAELYGASVRAARAAKAPDVAARALIGGGSLASMRGNYPEARALFRRGLSAAIRAGADEHTRAAHHGLLVAALAARDVETALAHGWAAFKDTSPQSPDERAEMLVNLGELGRYAGEFRATLGACLSAIELTDTPRLRLAALSTAASAAAELGETRLLAFVARELERTIVRSGQSYENARALVALAEAYARVGLPAVAQELADRAATLAAEGQFHEVVVALDALRVVIGGRRMSRPAHRRAQECWSTATRKVFLSLERLPSAALRSELAGVGAT